MTADEENYEEAVKAVNSSFGGGKPDAATQLILNDDSCVNLNKKVIKFFFLCLESSNNSFQSKSFWIMARALRDFVEFEGAGYLPLPGTIPDMTADTSQYVNLQNVYRSKALLDSDVIYRRVQQLLKELELSSDLISEKDIRLFSRESAHLGVIRGTQISDEYDKHYKATTIADKMESPDSLMGHYVALRAMEKFQSEHGYVPGECQVNLFRILWLYEHSNNYNYYNLRSNLILRA